MRRLHCASSIGALVCSTVCILLVSKCHDTETATFDCIVPLAYYMTEVRSSAVTVDDWLKHVFGNTHS